MPSLKPLKSFFADADKKAEKIFAAQQKKVSSSIGEFRQFGQHAVKINQQLDELVHQLTAIQETHKIAVPTPKQVVPTKEGELPQQAPGAGTGRK